MKLYPFSVRKHAHSIEFYYNHVKNALYAMESGETAMDGARYDRLSDFLVEELTPLYNAMFNSRDGRVVYLTGREIGLAREIVSWASERRAESIVRAGKSEYLQYC